MNVYLCLLVFVIEALSLLHALGLDEYPCMHDEIAERNPHVSIIAHGEPGGRVKRQTTNYSNIRISPILIDIDPEVAEHVNETNGTLIRSIEILESILMVNPVEDTYILSPICNENFTTGINAGKCKDPLPENISCGATLNIPDEYFSVREVCSSQDGPCRLDGPNGTGIPNTDYLLLVSATNTSICAANRIYAYSSACIVDGSENHKPVAGYIHICPQMFINTELKDENIVNIFTHELIHALGFSASLYHRYVDENGNNYNSTMDILGPYGPVSIFTGSKVRLNQDTVEFARSYYSCDSIEGVAFENEESDDNTTVSSHWERRTLNHEIMNGIIFIDYSILSEFTIALFEDTGWYKANYSALYALNQQKLHWGKDLGCSFLTEECTNKSIYPYLCEANLETCTADHLSKGFCSTDWRYFDGCAVAGLTDIESYCRNELSRAMDDDIESFGNNSICVDAVRSMNYSCGTYLTKPVISLCVSQDTYRTNNSLNYILTIDGSLYNCSDHRAIVTDSYWTVLCPPAEEVALQSLSLINDELPMLSPSKEIVISDLNKLETVEFFRENTQNENRICLPEFYPFGLSENDLVLLNNSVDVISRRITLTNHMYFYGEAIKTTYVSDNGIISFVNSYNGFTPTSLPQFGNRFIAPYWADVDLTATGQVFYRQTNDTALLAASNREIQAAFPSSQDINVTNLFIVTWYGVGYYRGHTDRINTFQCVIAMSRTETYVTFIYVHGGLQWTTGDSSSGFPALAGINVGDGINNIIIPGSLTANITSIAQTSNVGIPGVWMFRVGEAVRVYLLRRDYTVIETAGSARIVMVISGGTSNIPITFTVTPSEQSPISAMGSDVDFDSNAINLTYIPNRLIIENIRIPIICDYVKEESQSFDVTIATDSPLVYIDNDKVTVTITDNTVNFYQSSIAVREDTGTVSLELTLSQPVSQQFQIVIGMMSNDALDEEDYNGARINVSMQTGTFSQSIRIEIYDDDIIEGDETFTAQIVSISACGVSIGNNNTIEIIIIDNEEILSDQYTQVDGNVIFTCMDYSSFDYTWQYNGFTIFDEPGHITGANSSTLIITNVTATDWGTYLCIATHRNFNRTNTAQGILHVSPEGTVSVTEDILTTHSSSVNITCTAEGGPDNVYEWRKQGDIVSSDPRLYFQSITGSGGGVYQCTVINEAGGDTASVFLSVAPYNAAISESVVNDTTIYTCYADGGPGNQYYWVHQEGSIEFSQLLVFTGRDQSNEGTYSCTITNDAGTITRSISFTNSPTISLFPKMQTVALGSQFELTCNASGNPPPHIEWRRNGRVYSTSEGVDITVQSFSRWSVGSISVSTAVQDDGGLYECVAINVLGVVSDNATVTVAGTYEGQRCIELPQSTEGFEVINCTSGVAGVGYHGDTCVIVYSNTMGQLYQLRSCQENTGWTIISELELQSVTNYTQTANVMDMVNFTCNVTGFPYTSTQISWIFPPSTLDDRININTVIGDDYVVSTLTIKSIQLTDAGLYKCAASVEGLVGNILFNLTVAVSTGCQPENDNVWDIQWLLTAPGSIAEGQCPSGSGIAYRLCLQNSTWDTAINDTECRSSRLKMLDSLLSDISGNTNNLMNSIGEVEAISKDVSDLTNVSTGIAPNELNTTNNIISELANITRSVVQQNLTSEMAENLLSIVESTSNTIDNLLADSNAKSFEESQDMQLTVAEDLLRNTENWAVVIGEVIDAVDNDSSSNITITPSQGNIVFNVQRVPENPVNNIIFPEHCDDQVALPDDTTCNIYISIPANAIIHQRTTEGIKVPVVNFIARNLLSFLSNQTTNETYGNTSSDLIISSQISKGFIQLPENGTARIGFYVGSDSDTIRAECVFWNFSLNDDRNQSKGGWSNKGIIQDDNSNTKISCVSTHLTSFSVLVSAKAKPNHKTTLGLDIVSYIGCGISIFCLLLTIAAILILRKITFKAKHNKIHLNFAIALLLGLIVFVSGIETARHDRVGCIFVTSLLHYLFLAVFCWALCEGIIIYIMFATPFYKGIFQKWLFFSLLGWGLPVPIVVISVGLSYENYAIKDNSGNRIACWISDEDGAIWAFIGPMIAILLINCTLLTISIWSIYQAKRKHSAMTEAQKSNYKIVKILIVSMLALLPLLCGTWILGLLFLIDSESEAIAWIFTIINSLQGFLIFIFHVVRNKEVSKGMTEKFIKWKKHRLMQSSTRISTVKSQHKQSKKDTTETGFGSSFSNKNSTALPANRLSVLSAKDSSFMDDELAVLAKNDYSQSETL